MLVLGGRLWEKCTVNVMNTIVPTRMRIKAPKGRRHTVCRTILPTGYR